jgi:uncharacterized protein (DUF111 family)
LIDDVCFFYPAIVPLKVGYGAGTKDFAELPNVLRLIYGQTIDSKIIHKMTAHITANKDKDEQALLVNKR